jgi:RNA polymerase sigma-70 factor (ECF subfamily)
VHGSHGRAAMTHPLIDLPLGRDAAVRPYPDRVPGDNHDDMVLIQACKNGDTAAFEQLVKRYDRRLLRIAQHVTHNLQDAQDAVQEAFLKVFRRLTQFQEKSKFSIWLIRITINESMMKLRKLRSIKEVPMDSEFQGEEAVSPFEVVDSTQNPEELYQGSEVQHLLRSALQKLQPAVRVVFVLRDVEGFTIEETAEALELTQAAVKARLWQARLELRQRLSKYFAAQRSLIRATQ